MGADVLGQLIEACLCFGAGAYFGVKIAFTEIIGECSGRVLKSILELMLGVSFILLLYAAIFWLSDGNLKYYHFLIEFLGTIATLKPARMLFRRYKRGIQRAWIWLLGKNDVPDAEPRSKRIRIKNPETEKATENSDAASKRKFPFRRARLLKNTERKDYENKKSASDKNRKRSKKIEKIKQ